MANKKSLVKVRYFGPISFTLGQKEEEFIIDSPKIELVELINRLIKKYGHDFKELIIEEDGQLKANITVYINNQRVNGIKDKVCQGDEVYFFIALTGG